MVAGSNQLTLPASAGFAVGDHVIVELGREAGAGQRGTVGVGGTWPALSYASLSAMNADTSRPLNTFAWITNSSGISGTPGDVYQWQGSSWVARASDPQTYYTNKAVPKALRGKITAIGSGGTVLTLDTTSAVATAAANVYYDNQNVFNSVLGDPSVLSSPTGTNIIIPAGSFAVGDQIQFAAKTTWSLSGAGSNLSTIFSPKGVPSAFVNIFSCSGITVHDLALQGNALANGYGLQWGPVDQQVTETFISQGDAYPSGFLFTDADNGTVYNLKITDVFQHACSSRSSENLQVSNIQVFANAPRLQYVQWFFVFANVNSGSLTDCTINSRYLIQGFSAFQSKNIKFTRITTINAAGESNSCGGNVYQDINITVKPNDPDNPTARPQFNNVSFDLNNPLLNIDGNQGYPDGTYAPLGITVNNIIIDQQSYINAENDSLEGVNVDTPAINVTINGTSYTAPNYASPSPRFGPLGVNSTAPNTHLSNFTVVGVAQPGSANISISGGGGSSITNCTAQVIVGP